MGVPLPKVYWLRNGSPLETTTTAASGASEANGPDDVSSATSFVQSADGHLLLGEAELKHQGNYSCVAENLAARRVSEPAVLTVYGERFFCRVVGSCTKSGRHTFEKREKFVGIFDTFPFQLIVATDRKVRTTVFSAFMPNTTSLA